MKSPKRWLIAIGILVAILLATAVILPLVLRGPVAARARAAVNDAVDARVDWGGIDLTFFRDFPHLTLGLDGLTVVGTEPFAGDTLATMQSFRLVLDAGSVLRSVFGDAPIVVRSVRLERPALSLAVLEDGTANWAIVRERPDEPAAGSEAARPLRVQLQELEVSDGTVVYRNERSGLHASLGGLAHTLSGDFTRDSLGIRTRTHAERATVRHAGVPWLSDATLDFDAAIDADLADGRFAFRDNVLRINDLVLRFTGSVARAGAPSSAGDPALAGPAVAGDAAAPAEFDVDIAFSADETDFGRILSLVPVVYRNDFESLETSGTFALAGHARGRSVAGTLPELAIDVTVEGGQFRYPDLPLPARAIALELGITNPGGPADSTVVALRRFHAEIGGDPVDATLTLRTPVSDPHVDVRVRGSVDLADVPRTIKLESVRELAGIITADAFVRARRSDVAAQRYGSIDAGGTLSARNVVIEADSLRQPVAIEEMAVRLSPQRSDLDSFRATLGSSDLQAVGWLENLPGFLLWDQPLRGSATFTSRQFVLDEWMSDDPEREVIDVPPRLDFTLDGSIERVLFRDLALANARGTVIVRDRRVTFDGFGFETLGGRIGIDGHYETIDPARPGFAVDLVIDSVDIRSAAEQLLTVRTLAPVAQYARGSFSANLDLSGALGSDLTPLFDVLTGSGSLLTSRISLDSFPPMQRIASMLHVPHIANPTLEALRSSIAVRDGRLHVSPVEVGVGDVRMLVSGSNGIDRSLDYTLQLAVPRALLGEGADRLVRDLADRVGRTGVDLAVADSVRFGARLTGTVADPSVDLGLGDAAASVGEQAMQAAEATVERQIDEARTRLDSAAAAARLQAQARADSLIARAEEQAAAIRTEAARLAEQVRTEGNRQADEVLARASGPIARRAAEPVANRLRQEADERAAGIEREAEERAAALVAEARRQAAALVET